MDNTHKVENTKRGWYIGSKKPFIYEKYPQTLFPFSSKPPLPYKSSGYTSVYVQSQEQRH